MQESLMYKVRLRQIAYALLAALILATNDGVGQSQHIVPSYTVRVDTIQSEVREVLRLFEMYLNSRPDSLYDNPFWSDRDKSRHPDFYAARAWIFSSKD